MAVEVVVKVGGEVVVDEARGPALCWAAARRQRELGSEEPARAWALACAGCHTRGAARHTTDVVAGQGDAHRHAIRAHLKRHSFILAVTHEERGVAGQRRQDQFNTTQNNTTQNNTTQAL